MMIAFCKRDVEQEVLNRSHEQVCSICTLERFPCSIGHLSSQDIPWHTGSLLLPSEHLLHISFVIMLGIILYTRVVSDFNLSNSTGTDPGLANSLAGYFWIIS